MVESGPKLIENFFKPRNFDKIVKKLNDNVIN